MYPPDLLCVTNGCDSGNVHIVREVTMSVLTSPMTHDNAVTSASSAVLIHIITH